MIQSNRIKGLNDPAAYSVHGVIVGYEYSLMEDALHAALQSYATNPQFWRLHFDKGGDALNP